MRERGGGAQAGGHCPGYFSLGWRSLVPVPGPGASLILLKRTVLHKIIN